MKSALECFQHATELKRLADAKVSEGTRQRLLRTAEEWHQLGVNAERMEKANADGLRSPIRSPRGLVGERQILSLGLSAVNSPSIA